jgi:hypothetical protein
LGSHSGAASSSSWTRILCGSSSETETESTSVNQPAAGEREADGKWAYHDHSSIILIFPLVHPISIPYVSDGQYPYFQHFPYILLPRIHPSSCIPCPLDQWVGKVCSFVCLSPKRRNLLIRISLCFNSTIDK